MNYLHTLTWPMGSLLISIMFLLSSVHAAQEGTKRIPVVKEGVHVYLEYTLKSEDGEILDSNVGKPPMNFIHGKKQIVPGLEKELEGLKKGDTKHVVVKPEDAYGNIKEDAVREIPKEKIPAESHKIGAQIQGRTATGRIFPATVKELKEETIVIDYNHPLAGQTLYFDIKVVDIKEPVKRRRSVKPPINPSAKHPPKPAANP